jgi:hypothetical protein
MGPFSTVHYNGYVEASKKRCSKDTMGPLMTVHSNAYVEASKLIYIGALWGP